MSGRKKWLSHGTTLVEPPPPRPSQARRRHFINDNVAMPMPSPARASMPGSGTIWTYRAVESGSTTKFAVFPLGTLVAWKSPDAKVVLA